MIDSFFKNSLLQNCSTQDTNTLNTSLSKDNAICSEPSLEYSCKKSFSFYNAENDQQHTIDSRKINIKHAFQVVKKDSGNADVYFRDKKSKKLSPNHLKSLAMYYNKDYVQMSKVLTDFTPDELKKTYEKISRPLNSSFTKDDDAKLKGLYEEYGPNYAKIAKQFDNKSASIIKKRLLFLSTMTILNDHNNKIKRQNNKNDNFDDNLSCSYQSSHMRNELSTLNSTKSGLTYNNIIGNNYIDSLTFTDEDLTILQFNHSRSSELVDTKQNESDGFFTLSYQNDFDLGHINEFYLAKSNSDINSNYGNENLMKLINNALNISFQKLIVLTTNQLSNYNQFSEISNQSLIEKNNESCTKVQNHMTEIKSEYLLLENSLQAVFKLNLMDSTSNYSLMDSESLQDSKYSKYDKNQFDYDSCIIFEVSQDITTFTSKLITFSKNNSEDTFSEIIQSLMKKLSVLTKTISIIKYNMLWFKNLESYGY